MPGLKVQACGDCHLMNFGAFLSPEGNALFDINDFDETLPGVDFTVDIKRLAASFAVAAAAAGEGDKTARRMAKAVASAYRRHMQSLSALSPLEVWHSCVDLGGEAAKIFDGPLAKKLRQAATDPHADRQEDANFPHLEHEANGAWRIADRPPLIYHDWDGEDPALHANIAKALDLAAASFLPEVAPLLSRYGLVDTAVKVVGVGSVGTYCAIGLYMTEDGDHLFLQIKQAMASVLERLHGQAWVGPQGARVVSGQRIMQAAADPFLGYATDPSSGRQFYVRHLKNRRLGLIGELLETHALAQYAELCGVTLARAHGRSADPATLWGYMGKSDAFDDAIASFATLYAAQNKKDFDRFVAAKLVPEDTGEEKAARKS
jgi:uncharacterized protein (DUF2252 family)